MDKYVIVLVTTAILVPDAFCVCPLKLYTVGTLRHEFPLPHTCLLQVPRQGAVPVRSGAPLALHLQVG